ncbi:MAG: DEAD/DEAH box helicase [Gammaproteobacteria bacterium]|nr:DEAD/DEAH box helicase [Gammaproteobacteria bacterium]
MSFHELHLAAPLLAAIQSKGYKKPTPIQQKAIPIILSGNDLIGKAPTGTGKTAAFMLPALHKIAGSSHRQHPQVLVLSPTRELANQITQVIYDYGKEMGVKPVSILGGMPYRDQQRKLSRSHDIIIGTPGRLMDYIRRGALDLSHISMLILDEADRMLDMGFIEDVEFIASQIPKKRQTLLFTATTDKRLLLLSQNILRTPQFIEVEHEKATLDNIQQYLYVTNDGSHKFKLLQHLLKEENVFKAVIFSGTKHNADRIARDLTQLNFQAGALHGDMNQKKRNRTITDFRTGKIQFLVATDVAARGIDINDISHVINYDLPKFSEDYVHRIGRTGRAGKEGVAISFASSNEFPALKKIERFTRQPISQKTVKGLEPHSQPKEEKSFGNKSKKKFGGKFGGRPERSFSERNERSEKRSFGNKPKRSFRSDSDRDVGDKPKKKFGGNFERGNFGDKPKRRFGDKPERNFTDRNERSEKRSFGDKPKRSFGDRPERSFSERSEKRSFGDKPKRSFGGNSDRNFGDKPKRTFGDRPERSFSERSEKRSSGEKPKRSFGGNSDRNFGDKPKRNFGDRPERSFGERSEKRSFGDKPKRSFGGNSDRNFGDKPKKKFGARDAGKKDFGKSFNKDSKKPFKKHFKKDKE